jgi:hypothetical protein
MAETSRQRAAKRLAELKGERKPWEPTYRELAKNFLPRKSRWLLDAGEANRNTGRHNAVVDGTPIFSARTLASGLLAGISSPSRPWIRFVTVDEDLMESGAVKEWLEFVQKRIMAVLGGSNFYNVLAPTYGECGVFGTASMMMLEHPSKVIHCRNYTIGSYCLAQTGEDLVDSFYYEGKMTVRQLHDTFGKEKLSPQTKAAYDSGQLEQWVDIVHLIEPNADAEYGKADSRNKPFRSCYYEVGNGDGFLRESGFDDFPVMAPRWARTGEDVYGAGPALDALGDAKQLQHQQRQKGKQIDKLADPPMWASTALKTQKSSLIPGDLTYADIAGTSTVPFQPVYVPNPAALPAIREDVQAIQMRIGRAMYEDLFLMLASSDRRQVTAEEIARRYEEKILMLDPVLTQQNTELLTPAIDRVYYICARRGEFPPPPTELEGQSFKPEYIGILSQAQRLVMGNSVRQAVSFATELATAQAGAGLTPDALDKIDIDQAIDEFGMSIGAPAKVIRADDKVAEIREARAKAAQAQALAASAKPIADAAGAAKDLSETQVGGTSALNRMVGAA